MTARSEKTLVVPLVAMGSVPQYAVQLVIDSRRGELAKRAIESLFVYPFAGREMGVAEVAAGVAGSRAKAAGEMVSPWELYADSDGSVEYMQMHSPVIPGCESRYVAQLVDIVKERGYRRVVLLDAFDRGLWHGDGETAVAAAEELPSGRTPDLAGVSVLRWGNRTLGGMKLAAGESAAGGPIGADPAGGDPTEEWPGPFARMVGAAVDAAGEDVAVEAYAVPVYDGWNVPAAQALAAAAGLAPAAGERTPRGEALESLAGRADAAGLARLEGVYN